MWWGFAIEKVDGEDVSLSTANPRYKDQSCPGRRISLININFHYTNHKGFILNNSNLLLYLIKLCF